MRRRVDRTYNRNIERGIAFSMMKTRSGAIAIAINEIVRPEGAQPGGPCRQTDKSIDRQTHRHIDRQTDRRTDRQTDRQTDNKTDRQAGRQTDT